MVSGDSSSRFIDIPLVAAPGMVEGAREPSGVSSVRAPPSRPLHLPEAPPPAPSHQGVGFSVHIGGGGHRHSVCSNLRVLCDPIPTLVTLTQPRGSPGDSLSGPRASAPAAPLPGALLSFVRPVPAHLSRPSFNAPSSKVTSLPVSPGPFSGPP